MSCENKKILMDCQNENIWNRNNVSYIQFKTKYRSRPKLEYLYVIIKQKKILPSNNNKVNLNSELSISHKFMQEYKIVKSNKRGH